MNETRYCPYVGLADDRETHTLYPSPRNCCHQRRPPCPIPLEEQALHCLTVYYVRCAAYRQACERLAVASPKGSSSVQKQPNPLLPPAAAPAGPTAKPAAAQSPPVARTKPAARSAVARDKLSAVAAVIFYSSAALLMLAVIVLALWWQGNSQALSSPPTSLPLGLYTATPTYFLPQPPTPRPTSVIAIPLLTQPAPTLTASPAAVIIPSDTLPPPTMTPTWPPSPTPTVCSRPSGWIPYTVNVNDTLFGLSLRYGISVAELQAGNCLGSRTLIRMGEVLYVPNVPTPTPVAPPSETPAVFPSETATLSFPGPPESPTPTITLLLPTSTPTVPTPYP